MPRLRYTSAALDNLTDIAVYIARVSGSRDVAENFTNKIRQKCAKLAELPGTLGRARPELRQQIRSFAFKGYVIFFQYDNGDFIVVNVLEGHRDILSYFADETD